MNGSKSDFHPSAPAMEDIPLDDPEIAVAPSVPTAVPVYYYSNARPAAVPIPVVPALPVHEVHSPCCPAVAATAPEINVPVVTATLPAPQFTVTNEDYDKNMRLYSAQLRTRRAAVCIVTCGLFVVLLVVGIVVATRQREEYNSWAYGHT